MLALKRAARPQLQSPAGGKDLGGSPSNLLLQAGSTLDSARGAQSFLTPARS